MAFAEGPQRTRLTYAHRVPTKLRLQFSIWHLLVLTTLLGIVLASTMECARRMMAINRLRARAVMVDGAISRMSVGSCEVERHSTSSILGLGLGVNDSDSGLGVNSDSNSGQVRTSDGLTPTQTDNH